MHPDVTYDAATGSLSEQRYSWASAQACEYETAKVASSEERDARVAAAMEANPAPEARDLKKFEATVTHCLAIASGDMTYIAHCMHGYMPHFLSSMCDVALIRLCHLYVRACRCAQGEDPNAEAFQPVAASEAG